MDVLRAGLRLPVARELRYPRKNISSGLLVYTFPDAVKSARDGRLFSLRLSGWPWSHSQRPAQKSTRYALELKFLLDIR